MTHGRRMPFFVALAVVSVSLLLLTHPLVLAVGQEPTAKTSLRTPRTARILERELSFLRSNPNYDYPIPVIVRAGPALAELLERSSGTARIRSLASFRGFSLRLTAREIDALLAKNVIEYATIDAVIRATGDGVYSGHLGIGEANPNLRAIGADRVTEAGIKGQGVGIAVFDSGIAGHFDLWKRRVLLSVDFTDGKSEILTTPSDSYGHGTAVAGVIGGTGMVSGGTLPGVAPGAHFVSLRVV